MADAKYTLDDITPGPPTKFSYTEIATGETTNLSILYKNIDLTSN